MSVYGRSLALVREFFAWGRHTAFIRNIILLLCAAPPVFCLFAIFWGGLRYPFWDHLSTAELILKDHEGALAWQDFFAPHNEHILAVPRWLGVQLARVTGWDVGAELAVNFILLLAVFAVCTRYIASLFKTAVQPIPLLPVLLTSIFVFAPAGHNNMWWSFMSPLILVSLFSYCAFSFLSVGRLVPSRFLLAVGFGWLATFSLANGAITFCAMTLVLLMEFLAAKTKTPRDVLPVLVMAMNAVFALMLLSGGHSITSAAEVSLLRLTDFVIVYLGTPLSSIVDFSFKNVFEYPTNVQLSRLAGLFVLGACGLISFSLLRLLAGGDRRALFPLACIAFAFGSGLIIGIGRASAEDAGLALAGASRYTLFSSFSYTGILSSIALSISRMPVPPTRPPAKSMVFGLGVLTILSFAGSSYKSGLSMFEESAHLNHQLSLAYSLDADGVPFYEKAYPNPDRVLELKARLLQARIGPYHNVVETSIARGSALSSPLEPRLMTNGEVVEQQVTYDGDGWICGVRYQLVTWDKSIPSGTLRWSGTSIDGLALAGSISLDGLSDWSTVTVPVVAQNASTIRISVDATAPVGLPFRTTTIPAIDVAAWRPIDGQPVISSLPHEIIVCR